MECPPLPKKPNTTMEYLSYFLTYDIISLMRLMGDIETTGEAVDEPTAKATANEDEYDNEPAGKLRIPTESEPYDNEPAHDVPCTDNTYYTPTILKDNETVEADGDRSFLSMLPISIQRVASQISLKTHGMSDHELESIVRPDSMLSRVRLSAWREYEMANRDMRQFRLANMSLHLGVPSYVIRTHMSDPLRLAWIMRPPASYDAILEESVTHGLVRLRDELLTMDIRDSLGGIDVKKAELLLKVVAFVDLRKNGSIVQRTEARNLNLTASTKDLRKLGKQVEMTELDARIKELESKRILEAAENITNEELMKNLDEMTGATEDND